MTLRYPMDAEREDNDAAGQPIPTRLMGPPVGTPTPPVLARPPVLPFGDVAWEDFERLVLRVARTVGAIEVARLYGIRGQAQSGIDIYLRHPPIDGASERPYTTIQARRVEQLTPGAVAGAVDDFVEGTWFERSRTFVLATSFSAISTEVAEEIERAVERLRTDGVVFEVWDGEWLSERLRSAPDLVDDFFGRPWTVAFCGEELAASLRDRLDPLRLNELRTELQDLYTAVFSIQDPGGHGRLIPAIPLSRRFVVPDAIPKPAEPFTVHDSESLDPGADQPGETDDRSTPNSNLIELALGHSPGSSYRTPPRRETSVVLHPRKPVDTWLASQDRSLIVGVPGAGKSALLRFIALDLLSDEPRMRPLADRFGSSLPVWLPFAFWTTYARRQGPEGASLPAALSAWLEQYGRGDLWPLLEAALNDSRLLLLVDGLDEWSNEDAGRWALQTLQVFVEDREVAAILTARPFALARLASVMPGWGVGEIAPLSDSQQEDLARRLLERSIGDAADTDSVHSVAALETERFIADIRSTSSGIADLAAVPLFLVLLVRLRLEQVRLPAQRLEAYDQMLSLLVRDHPAARRASSSSTREEARLGVDEVQRVLAGLAYAMQQRGSLIATDAEIDSDVRSFLTSDSGLGLSSEEARSVARGFVDIAEGVLGVLVRTGLAEASFFHRSLHEYLAGLHLSTLQLEQQVEIAVARVADPQWRDTLLTMTWALQRPTDKALVVEAMERPEADALTEQKAMELATEIAVGDFGLSRPVARRIAGKALDRIEMHDDKKHRDALLSLVVNGLQSTAVGEVVAERLEAWAVGRDRWPSSAYAQLAAWPKEDATQRLGLRALKDSDQATIRQAGISLAKIYAGNVELGDLLADWAGHAPSNVTRAACLEALFAGWPDHGLLGQLVSETRRISDAPAKLVAIGIACCRRETDARRGLPAWAPEAYNGSELDPAERDWLLSRLTTDSFSADTWDGVAAGLIASSWRGQAELFEVAKRVLTSVPREGSDSLSFAALFLGFQGDDAVAEWIADRFRNERYPLSPVSGRDLWHLLELGFGGHPSLAEAVEEWAAREQPMDIDLAGAAHVARSETMKRRLLTNLDSGTWPQWATQALLDGWGMQDEEVRDALTGAVSEPSPSSGVLAHLIPDILGPDRALELLLEQRARYGLNNQDRVIFGLSKACRHLEDPPGPRTLEVGLACLESVLQVAEGQRSHGAEALALYFPRIPGVRDLVMAGLESRTPNWALAAQSFPVDPDIRSAVRVGLGSLPTDLREALIRQLSHITHSVDLRLRLFAKWDQEMDSDLKVQMSLAYHGLLLEESRRRPDDQSISGAIVNARVALRAAASSYGIDHEERRMAAWAGALALGELSLFDGLTETIGLPDPISVRVSTSPSYGSARFVEAVAAHWDAVKEYVGNDELHRLSGRSQEVPWPELARVAPDYPSLAHDLLNAIEADAGLLEFGPVLLFAQTPPRDSRLDTLMNAVSPLPGGRGEFHRPGARTVARVLLSDPEAIGLERDEVRAELQGRCPQGIYGGDVLHTLLWGYPEQGRDLGLYRELEALVESGEEIRLSYGMFFAIRYAGCPASEIMRVLARDLARLRRHDFLAGSILAQEVLRRLERDAEARQELVRAAVDPSIDHSLLTVIATLLGSSGRLDRDVKERLRAVASEDRETRVGLMAPDLRSDEERSVRTLCLELLRE